MSRTYRRLRMQSKPTVSRTLGVAVVCLLTCLCVSSTLQAAKLTPQRRIAILPLTNLRPNTDTDWIGGGAADTLTTKLAGIPALRIVERTQLDRIIEEHDLQKADVSDVKTAVKIGKLVGAERVLVGTYARSGKNILFNVRVVDVQTGVALNTASVQMAEAKIFDALFELVNAVIKSFDKKVMVVRNQPRLADAPKTERIVLTDAQRERLRTSGTTNLEAFRALSRGIDAGGLTEKIRWYTRAIELDPKYAAAWR